MAVPALLQVHGITGDTGRLQTHLLAWIRKLAHETFLSGNDIITEADASGNATDGIVFLAGIEKKVPHKLGKKPKRCFLTRVLSGSPNWFESFPADANYVYLTFAANSIVYLRVE